MKAMPIDDLLEKLLFKTRGAYNKVGLTKDNWNNYKRRYKAGKLSHEKKQEILRLFGFRMAEFEMWEK